jgi:hypothetical protein
MFHGDVLPFIRVDRSCSAVKVSWRGCGLRFNIGVVFVLRAALSFHRIGASQGANRGPESAVGISRVNWIGLLPLHGDSANGEVRFGFL